MLWELFIFESGSFISDLANVFDKRFDLLQEVYCF